MKRLCGLSLSLLLLSFNLFGQEDSLELYHPDSTLRITNLNPYFTLHVDSSLSYQLQINKNPENYFWYLRNSPVGLRINKDNGLLSFNANKSYFLSGRLKYDVKYNVQIGVQNLRDPADKIDTGFVIVFYNTEIIPSLLKPTVPPTIWVNEGETMAFKVLCETGSFPIENIITVISYPIADYKGVSNCGDEFRWTPPYELVSNTDSGKVKIINLQFVGSTKFQAKDTATIKVIVKDGLNYPLAVQQYNQVVKNMEDYILQLKYSFLLLDRKLKKTKTVRTTFDLTSATTSVTGTVLTTSSSEESQRTGKILPSVALALVPIKEASAPNKVVDQNQAALIRSSIRRMEYMVRDNMLLGEKDPEILTKTNRLKEELKQVQIQLIDVPVEFAREVDEKELDEYFNSPKVNKKYRVSRKR